MAARSLSRDFFQRLRAKKTLATYGTFLDLNASGDKCLAAAFAFDIALDATNATRTAGGTGFDYKVCHVDRLLETSR